MAMLLGDYLNPQRVFWELSPLLSNRTIMCGDSDSHTNWYLLQR